MIARTKWLNRIHWDENGLVPVIAQEVDTNEVLMFAWMNRDALARTVELGLAFTGVVRAKNSGTRAKNPGISRKCRKYGLIVIRTCCCLK
jgi:phosphoribosyl-AMP cyclohydrolase